MISNNTCVLTINGGSSGIKFSLYQVQGSLTQLFYGNMESIGGPQTTLSFTNAGTGEKENINVNAVTIYNAPDVLVSWLEKRDWFVSVKAIGHRIVHGMKHTEPELITPELLHELKDISAYDPEHLPGEIMLIEEFGKRYPAIVQVACFDTSFHTSMPTSCKITAHTPPV